MVAVATISRAQAMARDLARITLAHGRREIALHFAREVRIVGQVGIEQMVAQPDLAVGQHHRELGSREAQALLAALEEFVVAGRNSMARLRLPPRSSARIRLWYSVEPLGRALLEHR